MAEHRFHTPDPLELEVNVPVGSVDVETVDGEESLVTVEGDERLVEQTRVELDGRVLSVHFRGKKPFGITISIGDFSFGNAQLRVRAQVPRRSEMRLTTASADMRVRGDVRELETKTASGDLVVSGEIERDATVKSVSGDVHLDAVGGDLRVQSVSGDVDVDRVGGSVEAKSVSGDLRVDWVRQGHASFTSISGDIELGIAPGSILDVDAGSVSGDLSSDVPLADAPPSEADGPTVVVRGKTVSGDFRVFRAA